MRCMISTCILIVFNSALNAEEPDVAAETAVVEKITKLGGEAFVEVKLEPSARVQATFPAATDALLLSLSKLPNLGALIVSDGTKMTDKGYAYLRELPNLQRLNLTKPTLTEKSLTVMGGLRTLQVLYLGEAKIGEPTLAGLKPLKNLREFDLFECKLGDKCLANLSELPAMESLNLSGNPTISDTGILAFEKSTKLKLLKATRTNVTAAGARKLEEAKPGLVVRY